MKAFEFDSQVAKNEIPIPADLAAQIPEGTPLRVILLVRGEEQEEAWHSASVEGFSSAYAPEDSIYESLVDEPGSR